VEANLHVLTSALDEDEWPSSRSGRFTPRIRGIRGWVCPGAGMDVTAKKKFRIPYNPARTN
jgi:hypothetical protein